MCPRGNNQTNIWTECNNTEQIFSFFSLNHKEIKSLVARQAKHKSKHLPCHFKTQLNDVDGIIIGGGVVARPLQFQLGKLPTMTGFIETQGSR
jgi:hypothetical protein